MSIRGNRTEAVHHQINHTAVWNPFGFFGIFDGPPPAQAPLARPRNDKDDDPDGRWRGPAVQAYPARQMHRDGWDDGDDRRRREYTSAYPVEDARPREAGAYRGRGRPSPIDPRPPIDTRPPPVPPRPPAVQPGGSDTSQSPPAHHEHIHMQTDDKYDEKVPPEIYFPGEELVYRHDRCYFLYVGPNKGECTIILADEKTKKVVRLAELYHRGKKDKRGFREAPNSRNNVITVMHNGNATQYRYGDLLNIRDETGKIHIVQILAVYGEDKSVKISPYTVESRILHLVKELPEKEDFYGPRGPYNEKGAVHLDDTLLEKWMPHTKKK